MVLIAGSLGAVLFLGFKFDGATSAIAGLAALTAMALYNTISNRLRDRGDLGDQIADLSRGTADLARQVAEISRRLNAMETNVSATVNRARSAVDPLVTEIGELGTLVRQIADTVAVHEGLLQQKGATPSGPASEDAHATTAPLALSERDAVASAPRLQAQSQERVVELVSQAIDEHRIDLYLQPIVTLPQRKVRYYEALSRLRTAEGHVVAANDFVGIAESAGLMPRIDNLLAFRCVQIARRLQLKSRDVGVFLNISASTLADSAAFRQLLDFMEANRAIAGAVTFEFAQGAYRNFGPIEHEGLAALAERGFRFSMDHVTDLRMEPKELADNSFRYLKVPAKLLLDGATGAQSDIHPEDLADLLARSGIDLIAERIENEAAVVDLLDYDVRFGQGFLFSAPRPVRSEALQGEGKPAAEATQLPAA